MIYALGKGGNRPSNKIYGSEKWVRITQFHREQGRNMSEEELLKAGISAARSGDMARASSLFAQTVKENPSSERGWFLLGMSCSAPDQREYCLRRVLALNPNNPEAIKQLAGLSKPAPATPPVRVSQPSVPPLGVPKPSAPATPAFMLDEKRESHAINNSAILPNEKPSVPKIDIPKERKSKKKNSNTIFLLAMLGVLALLIFGVGITTYILFFQTTRPLLPGASNPLPVAVATQTPAPLIATPTFTLEPPTAIPSPLPTVAYAPFFQDTPCAFDTPGDADVNCGYVIVPEDRTGDPSHTIKLAVAVFHSTSKNPAPDPVIFLQGGPGAEAIQLSAKSYSDLVSPFLPKRDFVVFDQRGTGLSEPALKCEELTKAYSQDIHGMIPSDTRELVYSNAFVSCNGLLSVKGVDLNAYTTVASAADLRDVLSVLGYQKANLYGASYGTRLALVTMRDYPEIVQSAILDSVVPVDANFFIEYPQALESALRALFDTCAASPECATAYPNLETVFWELVKKLDAAPVTVTTSTFPMGTITETVNGSSLMSIVLGSEKSSSLIRTTPQTIFRIRDGDYSTLIAAQYALPFTFEGINPGLYISMMCHEHILATTLEELQTVASRQDIKDYAWLPFYGDANDIFNTCKSWGAVRPAYGENAPVTSDIPTLIITGKYDPSTPPFYAQQVASQLSNSYYFEFPNQGHTPTAGDTSGCAMDTALAFLKDPTVEPSRACLNELKQVDFLVPYTGDPALPLNRTRVAGVSLDVPEDWYDFGDGFFMRANSPLDITQIGVLQVDISINELTDWLSSSAYGYRGLDSAPINAGQHNENGLKWTLYTSTSNGRPVDIAMANYRGSSLVIMMFCHGDERDALVRTVFLPMLDSAR